MKDGRELASPVFKKRFARRKTTHRPFTFALNCDTDPTSSAAQNQTVKQVGDRGVVITSSVQLERHDERLSISDIVRQSSVPVLIAHSAPQDTETDISEVQDEEEEEELDNSNFRRSGRSRQPSNSFLSRRQHPHGTPKHGKEYLTADYAVSKNNSNIDAEVSINTENELSRKIRPVTSGSSKKNKKTPASQNNSANEITLESSKLEGKAGPEKKTSGKKESSTGKKSSIKPPAEQISKSSSRRKGREGPATEKTPPPLPTTGSKTSSQKRKKAGSSNTAQENRSLSSVAKTSVGRKEASLSVTTQSPPRDGNSSESSVKKSSVGRKKASLSVTSQSPSRDGNSSESTVKKSSVGRKKASLSVTTQSPSRDGNSSESSVEKTSVGRKKASSSVTTLSPSREGNRSETSVPKISSKKRKKASPSTTALSPSKEENRSESSVTKNSNIRRKKASSPVTTQSPSREENRGKSSMSNSQRQKLERSKHDACSASSTSKVHNKLSVSSSSVVVSGPITGANTRTKPSGNKAPDVSLASSRRKQKDSFSSATDALKSNKKNSDPVATAPSVSAKTKASDPDVSVPSRKRALKSSEVSQSAAGNKKTRKNVEVSFEQSDGEAAPAASVSVRGASKSSDQDINGNVPRSGVRGRKKESVSVPSVAAPSGGRKRLASSEGEDDFEASGPSSEKKGRTRQSEAVKTTSTQKQSGKKNQQSIETSSQSIQRSKAQTTKASKIRPDGSAAYKKRTLDSYLSNVSGPLSAVSSQSQTVQKPPGSPGRFFAGGDRSPHKLVSTKIVGVIDSPRKARGAHDSFWKTTRRVSVGVPPRNHQSSRMSVSTVYDDENFGEEESSRNARKKTTQASKSKANRQGGGLDGDSHKKRSSKFVTECDVISDALHQTEEDMMDDVHMSTACQSRVHKAFTFTRKQLQQTASQLTEIRQLASQETKLKSQCKELSNESKENVHQKCILLQELKSLHDRGADEDMMRIDQWLKDFQALQQSVA